MNDHGHATLREKACFGVGSMTYCVEMVLVLTYFLLFCSDVMKINVKIVGMVIASVKILDAISDIVITGIADRTQGKWGKYRIWMLSGIPLAVMLVLLFSNPPFLTTEGLKILWVCMIYILLVPILETSVSCPYMALVVTMSEHQKDRLDFSMARSLGEAGSQIIISVVAMPVILVFGSYKDITGWRVMSCAIAAIIAIACLVCFFNTRERVYVSNENTDGTQMTVRDKFKVLKGNHVFWKVIGIIVFFMAHFYASSTLFTYFCIYNLGHEEWVSPLLTAGFVMQIVVTVFLFYLGRKFEKRTLLLAGGMLILIADVALFEAKGFTLAMCYQICLGVGNGIFNGMAFAMLPDVADYVEWKSGVALPGMISAVATFAMKLGGAVATLLASQMLSWANYNPTLTTQSEETLHMIRGCQVGNSALCVLVAVLITFTLRELATGKVKKYREEIDAKDNCMVV